MLHTPEEYLCVHARAHLGLCFPFIVDWCVCVYFTRGVLCYNKKGEGVGKYCSVYIHCCQQRCCVFQIHILCEAPWIPGKQHLSPFYPKILWEGRLSLSSRILCLVSLPSPGIGLWRMGHTVPSTQVSRYAKVQRGNLGNVRAAPLHCCSAALITESSSERVRL